MNREKLYQILAVDFAPLYEDAFREVDGGGWCHGTSATIRLVLERLGIPAQTAILEVVVFPHERERMACSIRRYERWEGMGRKDPDNLACHLVVVTDDGWLLDPSITQVNKDSGPRVEPVCVRIADYIGRSGKIASGRHLIVAQQYDDICYEVQENPYATTKRAVARHNGPNPPHWIREFADDLIEELR